MLITDIVIVGAGIAGAGLAWALGDAADVLLLEAEDAPGYHTTGRSAAFFAETYGGLAIQPLSAASHAFFAAPPAALSDTPLLSPRGCLHIAHRERLADLDTLEAAFAGTGVDILPLDHAETRALAPRLRADWATRALHEPGCRDIDVGALHAGFLRGRTVLSGARLQGGARDCDGWRLDTTAGPVRARVVVNAAGAWADTLAVLLGAQPLGLTPLRRTVVVARVDPSAPEHLPLIMDASGGFYFKPDGGRLWLSPHDETPDLPGDVRPDELDIAVAVDRFELAADWPVRSVEHSWAGLRTFAPDRRPVYGWDAAVPGLFWCAGQGGFGIQTAPAASRLAADLLLGRTPALDPAPFAAGRFAA